MTRVPVLGLSLLVLVGAALPTRAQDVVRTGDPVKRGLKEGDFPRTIRLSETVYAYEDLRSAGDDRFTTTNLFIVGQRGVLVADGQGNVAQTRGLVDAIARITPTPIKWVVIASDHGDHTAGNDSFPAGVTYIVHPTSKATLDRQAAAPAYKGWKLPASAELVADRKMYDLGGAQAEVIFLGRAHTGGDLNVLAPKDKILFMSEAYLNRIFPAMRSAYPTEWVAVVKKARAMDVGVYVPGHGFTEGAAVSRQELAEFQKALEAVIAEVTRLHKAGLSVEDAVGQANFGEYAGWSIAKSQMAIAVRKVYEELDGKLK